MGTRSSLFWVEIQLPFDERPLPMLRIAGVCLGILLMVYIAINAAFMLISPRAWFHLPAWLRATGSLTEERFSSGWGALQVRLAGAAFLAGISWVFHDIF